MPTNLYRLPIESSEVFLYMFRDDRFEEYRELIDGHVLVLSDPNDPAASKTMLWRDVAQADRKAGMALVCDYDAYKRLMPTIDAAGEALHAAVLGIESSSIVETVMDAIRAIESFNELAGDTKVADTFYELSCVYYRPDPPGEWIRQPEEAIWEAGLCVDDIAVDGDRDTMIVYGFIDETARAYKDPIREKHKILDEVIEFARKIIIDATQIKVPTAARPLWLTTDVKLASGVIRAAEAAREVLDDGLRKSEFDVKSDALPQLAMPFMPQLALCDGDILFDSFDYSRPEEAQPAREDMRDLLNRRFSGSAVAFAIDGSRGPELYGLVDLARFCNDVSAAAGPVVKLARDAGYNGLALDIQQAGHRMFTLTAYPVVHAAQRGYELDQGSAKRAYDDARCGRDMLERKKREAAALAAKKKQRGGLFHRKFRDER